MDRKILGVGPRTAEYLRTAYPKDRAKLIARDFNVSTGTAERWLRGHAPTVAHIEEMTSRFGEPYVRALFVEAFEAQDRRIEELNVSSALALSAGILTEALPRFATASADAPDTLYQVVRIAISGAFSAGAHLFGVGIRIVKSAWHSDDRRIILIEALIETVPPMDVSQSDTQPESLSPSIRLLE